MRMSVLVAACKAVCIYLDQTKIVNRGYNCRFLEGVTWSEPSRVVNFIHIYVEKCLFIESGLHNSMLEFAPISRQ